MGRTLVTNEFARHHPADPRSRTSRDWVVTSGSLFAEDGTAWSGPVDGGSPDPASRTATGSAVLRAVSARRDFGDVTVTLGLDVAGMVTTARTGERAYDGVHLFLRYSTPETLYAVSLCRRDDLAAIKRKEPADGEEDGRYTTLAEAHLACPVRRWQDYTVTVRDEPAGVRLSLAVDGRVVVAALDAGSPGSAPLRGAGRVGLRGDNTEFHVRDFQVTPLSARS
jgi:hypothetical protein